MIIHSSGKSPQFSISAARSSGLTRKKKNFPVCRGTKGAWSDGPEKDNLTRGKMTAFVTVDVGKSRSSRARGVDCCHFRDARIVFVRKCPRNAGKAIVKRRYLANVFSIFGRAKKKTNRPSFSEKPSLRRERRRKKLDFPITAGKLSLAHTNCNQSALGTRRMPAGIGLVACWKPRYAKLNGGLHLFA